jgi:hypothetical protein
MVTIPLKKILALSLFAVSFTINAAGNDREHLVRQCHDLSEKIISLISSQGKKSCVEKLDTASAQLKSAGELIANNHHEAKQELDNAIYSLQYAELNNCNRYIQISHSKFEAHKIKSSL